MPRNGSDVYSKPAGTTAVSGTKIESAKYNSVVDDLVTDANTARPVVAGGTGSSTAGGARTNLAVPGLADNNTLSGTLTASGAVTVTGSLKLNDSVTAAFGTGSDTTITHNGTNTVIADASSGLITKTASFKVQNAAGTENMIEAVQDSFVKLRHNNTARLTTTSSGVDINGTCLATTFSGAGATKFLLATKTASASATLDFTEFVNATYHTYEFYLENLIPGTDGDALWIRTSTDGGSTYDSAAGNYDWAQQRAFSGGSVNNGGGNSTRIEVTGGVGNAANENGVNGLIILHGAALAAHTTLTGQISYTATTGEVTAVNMAGRRNGSTDVDALRFLFSSGNIGSGKIRMYGLK